jgi:Raf kinase inhibitor-like YbhB/YbcL family protein
MAKALEQMNQLRRAIGLLALMSIGGLTACDALPFLRSSPPLLRSSPPLHLSSPAFAANADIPTPFTCDGANRSPALTWDTAPANTRSWVLLMQDLDAAQGKGVHWVVYDLPPDTRHLPEGLPTLPFLLEGGVQGKNDFGQYGYKGPCPPAATSHRYQFRLYALDKLLDLPPNSTGAAIQDAMTGHILAEAEFIGRYRRQP